MSVLLPQPQGFEGLRVIPEAPPVLQFGSGGGAWRAQFMRQADQRTRAMARKDGGVRLPPIPHEEGSEIAWPRQIP